jgi:NADPH-dependent glutamate synthase beta subunit-like oxidoreductase
MASQIKGEKMRGCPVNDTITGLENALSSGALKNPRLRRIGEEILDLLKDVAWGRAGNDHIPAISHLANDIMESANDENARQVGQTIASAVNVHKEVFESHVQTHNCATGDCVRLAPAPCQMACPAGIDVPTYVSLIALGKDAEAIEVIRKDNPFPWVCGLVCTRPCEFMCVRGRIDTPVSIKYLKAFAAEKALSDRRYKNPEKAPDKHQKVCVIGAGPGGMSAAYFLALKGYGVTVLEAQPVAGGMMMLGIPRYRLPREVIDREVAMIEELGVEFKYNTRFGVDVAYDQLKADGYEAILLAIGAHSAYTLNITGEKDFPQVFDAIDLLRNVALGHRKSPGKRVVVIGGGNVAIDAARTSLRLGSEEVIVAYRRTRHEMPADIEEVEQAEEEGIRFSFLTIPVEIVGQNGKLEGLKCIRADLVSREGSSRKVPVPMLGSEFIMEVDAVISAIGQCVDQTCTACICDLTWSRRTTIDVEMASMETSIPGVFAAGDAVTGPATVVEAIGGGKRAAEAIDRYLSGIPQPKMPPVPVRRQRVEWLDVPAATKMALKRPEMPLLNIERRRTTFQQAELGYSENQAREEARRCLRCDICRRCGRCVEVCRDEMEIDALNFGYLDFDHPFKTDFRVTEEKCILCGACAANCPNNAIVIEDRKGERILNFCGTILNRQKLLYCDSCGAVIGPARYHDYVTRRLGTLTPKTGKQKLCEVCARKTSAEILNF